MRSWRWEKDNFWELFYLCTYIQLYIYIFIDLSLKHIYLRVKENTEKYSDSPDGLGQNYRFMIATNYKVNYFYHQAIYHTDN